jgi:CheY-like chemotaxis protein
MSKKLLIVDDQPGITRIVALIARDEFIAFQPDVVILDMIMPDVDGIDVLTQIALTGYPVKIVVSSGYGEAYMALAAGVARFHGLATPPMLRKPFQRSQLEELLRGVAGSC